MSRADNVIGGIFIASAGGFFAIRIFQSQINQFMTHVPRPGIFFNSILTISVAGAALFLLIRNRGKIPYLPFSSKNDFTFSSKKSAKRLVDIAAAKKTGIRLEQIAYILKGGKKYEPLGIKPPKKILIQGTQGMGRATLTEALAGEIEAVLITISGKEIAQSDKKSLFLKNLIDFSISLRQTVILIEDAELLNEDEEFQKILEEELKRIPKNTVVLIVCSATCWADDSFFDMTIQLELPDEEMREKLLALQTLGKPLGNISFNEIARSTDGLGPADLKSVVDEAGRRAFDEDRVHITRNDFEHVLATRDRELIRIPPPPPDPKKNEKTSKKEKARTETGA